MPATLSAALVIAILVSLLKPYIEALVPPANSLHDGTIRLTAVGIGVLGEVLQTAVSGNLTPYAAWHAASYGELAGVTAIATFHLVTNSYFSPDPAAGTLRPPTEPPAPVEPPAYKAADLPAGMLPPVP
jgi:hypothetical protein